MLQQKTAAAVTAAVAMIKIFVAVTATTVEISNSWPSNRHIDGYRFIPVDRKFKSAWRLIEFEILLLESPPPSLPIIILFGGDNHSHVNFIRW